MRSSITILAVEPSDLSIPYDYLSEHYTLRRVTSVMTAIKLVYQTPPSLVLISSNIPMRDCVKLLDALKERSIKHIIPIVFVIDFRHRLVMLPGTSWAGHLGVLHSFVSKTEVNATVDRLLKPATGENTVESERMLEMLYSAEELAEEVESLDLEELDETDFATAAKKNAAKIKTARSTSASGLKPLSSFQDKASSSSDE